MFGFIIGEPENHHFYDFGISEPATKPQNQYNLSLGTPGYLKQLKKKLDFLKRMIFTNPEILKIQDVVVLGKEWHRKI